MYIIAYILLKTYLLHILNNHNSFLLSIHLYYYFQQKLVNAWPNLSKLLKTYINLIDFYNRKM